MRKGALNAAIKELGCNKIAYAHHKDDVIETMLLSLLYEGRFYSFPPKTYLDQMDLTVENPGVKNRMFTAILNAELSDWPDRIIPDRH